MSDFEMFRGWMNTNSWVHEALTCGDVSEESDEPWLVKDYCMLLLKIADECGPGSGASSPLTVELTLQVEGEEAVKSTEDMGAFLENLMDLCHNPKPFSFECKRNGRAAEKNWITDKNGERHYIDIDRKCVGGSLREDLGAWEGEETITYRLCSQCLDSGEWEIVKIENGEETDYMQGAFQEQEAFGRKGWNVAQADRFAPLTGSGCGDWYGQNTVLWALVDEEKHPDVMKKLYGIMEKHLSKEANDMAKEWREPDDLEARQVLCMDYYWDPKDIWEIQPMLDELNAVLLPIKEDIVEVVTDGYWVDMEHFRMASWLWTEEGFRLGVLDM